MLNEMISRVWEHADGHLLANPILQFKLPCKGAPYFGVATLTSAMIMNGLQDFNFEKDVDKKPRSEGFPPFFCFLVPIAAMK